MWRSENRAIFRRMACARLSSPTIRARSRGVPARHSGAGADPQDEVGRDRDRGHQGELGGVQRTRRRQRSEQADQDRPDHAPGEDRRRLVDGQVAHDAVVGVVEPAQLRDEDPDRQEGEHPDRPLGRHGDREGKPDRAAVREGEQAPAADVTPPPRLGSRPAGGRDERPSHRLGVEEAPSRSEPGLPPGSRWCLLLAHP